MSNKKGLLALSPLFLLIVLIVAFTVYSVDASHKDTNLSLTVAFMISSIYAIAISGGMPIKSRVDTYSKGAGANNLMLMLWIYVLAGSFAASAKAMGAVDATVNLALSILPASMILPGLFLAACFISVSIGTSVGTVVALVPIAAGLAHSMDVNIGMMTAIIVGGAYFGDNLSFISDTTVVATQTQNCKMSDKFRVNSLIVVPAAVIVLAIYAVMGIGLQAPTDIPKVEYVKVVPYLVVLVTAVAGMNVMAVLTMGTLLCGVIGVSCQLLGATGGYDLFGWFSAMGNGIIGMGESKALGPFVKACDQFKYLDLILDHGETDDTAPAAPAAEAAARANAGDDTAINRDSIGRIIHGLIDEMDDGTGWVRTSRVGDQLIKRYPDFDVRNFGSKSLNKFLASLPELEVEERILANGNPIQFVRVKPVPEPVKKPAPRRTAKRTTRKKK